MNALYKAETLYRPHLLDFIKMFSCVCPFVSEEIYSIMTGKEFIDYETWPTYDEAKLVVNEVNIAISVNGKVRSTVRVNKDIDDKELEKLALSLEGVQRHLEGKTVRKVIIVKGKIVNIVAN